MTKLLKTPMRGGIVTLTEQEIVLGEGVLGAKNVRRFPIQALAQLDRLPSPDDRALRRSVLLRFVWADGRTTDVDGIGPVAAQRIQDLLQSMRKSLEHQT